MNRFFAGLNKGEIRFRLRKVSPEAFEMHIKEKTSSVFPRKSAQRLNISWLPSRSLLRLNGSRWRSSRDISIGFSDKSSLIDKGRRSVLCMSCATDYSSTRGTVREPSGITITDSTLPISFPQLPKLLRSCHKHLRTACRVPSYDLKQSLSSIWLFH